jgi:hypothetical protein
VLNAPLVVNGGVTVATGTVLVFNTSATIVAQQSIQVASGSTIVVTLSGAPPRNGDGQTVLLFSSVNGTVDYNATDTKFIASYDTQRDCETVNAEPQRSTNGKTVNLLVTVDDSRCVRAWVVLVSVVDVLGADVLGLDV